MKRLLSILIAIALMLSLSVIVFAVAGLVTQWILKGKKEDEKDV